MKKRKIKNEFTRNETVALMHEDSAATLKSLVDFFKEWEVEREEIIEFMIEVSEEKAAQAVVCRLRDEL